MKMIEVFDLMAKGEIEKGTKLKIINDYNELYEYVYTIDEGKFCFLGEDGSNLCDEFRFDEGFLLEEVNLIPPKEKKYLIKVNVHGLAISFEYLNYFKQGKGIVISSKNDNYSYKTHFTKQELKSIQPVKEFLDDMQGKYELIEVEE